MDQIDKDATIVFDANDSDEDWHDQLLQLNTDVAMDFVKQNLEISNMESYCNAKEELLNELKLQVTMLEGEVNLKLQELSHLQEKEQLLTENLNTLNEMIDSKEETEDILLENERLLKSKRERHEKEWKKITDNYKECITQMRENFEKNPLAQKRLNLQIEVQKQRINLAILKQQVQDQKENNKMLHNIRKRREQIKIIKFARIMVDYYEMQKMKDEIKCYEKKFKEITENKRMQFKKEFVPKDDIFKVPQHKNQNKSNVKSPFELPPLNLSAYQINPQSFVPNKTINNEGPKSNYSLKKSMDTMLLKLNMNKRSQTFSPQEQKKLKSCFSLSKSLPYPQNAAPAFRKVEPLSLPDTLINKNPPIKENREKMLEIVANYQTRNDVTATTCDDIFEYTSQEIDASTAPTQPLKSPYFPPASGSASGTASSQIISSGMSSRNEDKTLEVSGEYNEHDVDIMDTNSFVSLEEFTSPPGPGPSNDVDADIEERPNNDSFLNNMFGGAKPSQTKSNISNFSFLNTPSRKKSSQNIFSMF